MRKFAAISGILCLTALLTAEEVTVLGIPLKIGGGLSYDFLHITKSSAIPTIESESPFLNKVWHQTFSGYLSTELEIGERLVINSGIGGQVGFDNMVSTVLNWGHIHRDASASLNLANAKIKLGNINNPANLTVGLFGYNYTRVHDFGGYLYTSGLHPMYLTSAGGGAGLLGLHIQIPFPKNFRQDLIVNFEGDWAPWMDVSLGLVSTINLNDRFEFGLGIKGHRIIPVGQDSSMLYSPIITNMDTLPMEDTVRFETHQKGADVTVDTLPVTVDEIVQMPYKGLKLMARAWFDPLKTFGVERGNFFGNNDLQVYGEIGINGVADYPLDIQTGLGYPKIKDRIPIMAGANLPTHPLIGNLAVPLLLSMFLISVEPDSVYFDGWMTPEEADNSYPENMRGDSVTFSTFQFPVLDEIWMTDTKGQSYFDHYDTIGWVDSVRVNISNKRGFFDRNKKLRPFIWAGASIISGLGTFLLEKTAGKRFRFDNISLEVEYCSSPFNENTDAVGSGLPSKIAVIDYSYIPDAATMSQRIVSTDWHYDDWRWALMFDKTILERVTIHGKIASDHFRQRDAWGFYTNIERLFGYYEWYWAAGISVGF
jgi:hypothetical protein